MNTLSHEDSSDLRSAFISLSNDCCRHRSKFDIRISEAVKVNNFASYQALSQRCQALLVSNLDSFECFGDLLLWAQTQDVKESVHEVIRYAMTLESAHLTTLGWWMSPVLKDTFEIDSDGALVNKIRSLFHQLCNSFSGLEDEKYREPAFYINGQFREGFLHSTIFSRKVNQAIVNVIDECLNDPAATRQWIEKIHSAYVDDPVTGQVIKDTLRQRLMDEPMEGLDGVRDYVLGQVMPKGEECSARCLNVFNRIASTKRSLDLMPDIQVMKLNERYVKNAFAGELIGHFQTAQRVAMESYVTTEQAPENPPNLKNLTQLYSQMSLDVDALCNIAMAASAEFTLGKMDDYQDEAPADRIKAVMRQMQQSWPEGFNPCWPAQAAMGSVLMTLPASIVAQVAQDDDYNRIMIYTLTGNSAHLSNMKDGRHLDAIMGADLGL
ncbi:hypothetical protein IFT48_03695 [Pseudomonas fluorescens]|uniref:hypothetical protein n=1 Tax=Pseudomonas fluorescens TaxID=294 RepID=UPI001930BFDF|nr:hypothetical protein [Pseudomonas fluorescens]MBD8089073.1 hypothetical protein [Pseudomonas fluorescens]